MNFTDDYMSLIIVYNDRDKYYHFVSKQSFCKTLQNTQIR